MSGRKPALPPQSPARRQLLAACGGLVIGFSLGGRAGALASTAAAPARGATAGPPDPKQIDSWLQVHADNTATLFFGFVELGQGSTTGLAQVAAEELDFGLDQVRVAPVDTHVSPNQGGTYSSSAIQRGRPQVALAAAEARADLLVRAAERLRQPVTALTVVRGRVTAPGNAKGVTYGELIGEGRFDLPFSGMASVKPVEAYRLVGKPLPRTDLPAKALGRHRYIQHERLPGMLHGRIVRPRGQAAYGAGAAPLAIDEASVRHLAGVRVLRRGDFVGVVAADEWLAVQAARDLKVTWQDTPTLPGSDALHAQMRAAPSDERIALERGDLGAGFAAAAHHAAQTCRGPYQAHAPFAPNCALADVRADAAQVICSSQDVYGLRRSLAPLLNLPADKIRVRYAEGAGTYGHSCYDDAAQAAALLSQLAGAPVRVQFMRWDEIGWDSYGPAHLGEVRVAATADGRLCGYEYHGWHHGWSLVDTSAQLAGTPATSWPVSAAQGLNPRDAGGMYDIPNVKLVNHWLKGLDYLRGAWLRSPLDLSFSFASEQAIDQLAAMLRMDPCEFRRRNIQDPRWRGVLDAVAEAAGWTPRGAAPSRDPGARVLRGRGIGLGTHLVSYGAAVADVEVQPATGVVRITHLWGAIDAGLVVNPASVESQVMGQLVQTASRLLKEEVTFDTNRVTSLDWSSYPILRFEDCPQVTPVVVQRLDERSTGAGEETMAAAAGAIANAFFDATGLRMAQYPLTPARVLAALRTANGQIP
jgi:CO/xanthine dehydrogenase Mo-binding subunit